MITVYYCFPEEFDEDFFEKAKTILPSEKMQSIEKVKNIKAKKESFCAWLLASYGFKEKRVKNTGLSFEKNGKPCLTSGEIFFNISHTDGMSLCAFSKSDIGIDVEKPREYRVQIERRVLCVDELEKLDKSQNKNADFFRLWTAKEAYSKFTGQGISIGFSSLNFSFILSGEKAENMPCKFYFTQENGRIISICHNDDEAEFCKVTQNVLEKSFLINDN